MFLQLFGIFVFFVEWGQTDVVFYSYDHRFNVTPEILRNAPPWVYYNTYNSDFRFECTHIGRYPYPYDCRSYYTCDKIAGSLELSIKIKRFWWPLPRRCNPGSAHFVEHVGCIHASELCTCPPGTFWAGPSSGCINDLKEMHACCNFKPDCVNGDGGDFGKCFLSTLGYKYSCRHDEEESKEKGAIIRVEKCERYVVSRGTCFPENPFKLEDLDLKTYKVLPVCKRIKYIIAEGHDTESTGVWMGEFVKEGENFVPEGLANSDSQWNEVK